MKRIRFHGFFVAFSLVFFLISCSNQKFFETDASLIGKFNDSKAEFFDIVKACKKSKTEGRTGKEFTGVYHFDNCLISPKIAEKYNIKYISLELRLDSKRESELKNMIGDEFEPYQDRILVTTNYAKEENFTVKIREKGYLYSPLPLKPSNITTESLDSLATAEHNRKDQPRKKEVWRYRQIEPNWYLYFHYISQETL